MLSVLEVKRKLPGTFVENLYKTYTPGTVDKILAGMCGERSTTLRANTLKIPITELMQELKNEGIKFNRVLWYQDALEIKNANEKRLQTLSIYEEGKFYLISYGNGWRDSVCVRHVNVPASPVECLYSGRSHHRSRCSRIVHYAPCPPQDER